MGFEVERMKSKEKVMRFLVAGRLMVVRMVWVGVMDMVWGKEKGGEREGGGEGRWCGVVWCGVGSGWRFDWFE